MGRLILLNRPGLQVVCGKVVSYTQDSVTIENSVYFSAMGKTENRTIALYYPENKLQKLKLRTGAKVFASIKPSEELIALYDGAYSKKKVFFAKAYTIRYTGSFDFAQYGAEKEQHVFCGEVLDVIDIKKGGNVIVLSWKKNGDSVQRRLYSPIDIKNSLSLRGAFVTGPPKDTSYGTIFVLKQYTNM